MSLPLTKTRTGKVCERHPELAGLRRLNYTCVGCDREKSLVAQDARRSASGKARRVLYSKEESAQRIRERERERSKRRRDSAEYNAAQLERKHKWRAENREHHLAVSRAYDAKQLAENLQRRISKNLRHRLTKAMLGKTRCASAVSDLGMSIDEFRIYIASRFQPGMSWDNYGSWHIDHIKPLSTFDLTDKAQASAACHYSNLQPLWALENQKKWCRYQVSTSEAETTKPQR